MSIRIEVLGKIINGKDKNHLVKILDDKANTGGFLILYSITNCLDDGFYDDWVENFESLKGYFNETDWVIEWQDLKPNLTYK